MDIIFSSDEVVFQEYLAHRNQFYEELDNLLSNSNSHSSFFADSNKPKACDFAVYSILWDDIQLCEQESQNKLLHMHTRLNKLFDDISDLPLVAQWIRNRGNMDAEKANSNSLDIKSSIYANSGFIYQSSNLPTPSFQLVPRTPYFYQYPKPVNYHQPNLTPFYFYGKNSGYPKLSSNNIINASPDVQMLPYASSSNLRPFYLPNIHLI